MLLVSVIAAGVWIALRGLAARDALLEARAEIASVDPADVLSGDTDLDAVMRSVREKTAEAAALTSDPVWRAAEVIPRGGPNLAAVRTAAGIADRLVERAGLPLAEWFAEDGLGSLVPTDGRIDVDALSRLIGPVESAHAEIVSAAEVMEGIDGEALIDVVESPISELQSVLLDAAPAAGEAADLVRILPGLLGSEEPRNYLLLFQNNAEVRAAGGNPAAMARLVIDDGRIELARQASVSDFPFPFAQPVIALDEPTLALYSDSTARYFQDSTHTPDFPLTAEIATTMWSQVFDDPIESVIAIDTVALTQILAATGDIALPTGEVLTSGNAVGTLLSDVYARYPVDVQDEVFAVTAATIFQRLTDGAASPDALIRAFTAIVEQDRFRAWSPVESENALFQSLTAFGINDDGTARGGAGVFVNDTTFGKMSYYLDWSIAAGSAQCGDDSRTAITTTLTSRAPLDAAATLPEYVMGTNFGLERGQIQNSVIVYGPPGSTFVDVSRGGVIESPRAVTEHLGRPAVLVRSLLNPGASETITATFTGGTALAGVDDVATTPSIRPTSISVEEGVC